jgi:hypothetical protein
MYCRVGGFCVVAALTGICLTAQPQPVEPRRAVTVVQGTLTAPGSAPFHLKAEITEDGDPSSKATVEMFWLDPAHWRRVIRSDEFSQTMVVNGERIFEQDSTNYFPLGLWSMVTAMVDPEPILAKLGPADQVRTKANGLSNESGITCFDSNHRMCMSNPWGLDEFVGGAGHSIEFSDYHPFRGKRIARRLIYLVSAGDFMTARVTELEDLKHPDDDLFAVDHPTDPSQRIRVATLDQAALMDLATEKSEIIWPQVLDGSTTGKASFYISIDTAGKIREVEPLRTANERSNDSAIRQIMRWKFKPPVVDGIPAQVEGVLTFDLNTRAWGPKDFLNDAEGRKLATNIVDPVVPTGSVPPGTVFRIWVAVDSDGIIIEEIVLDGPSQLFTSCDRALHQWHFQPILENGQPRPYRTLIEFRF